MRRLSLTAVALFATVALFVPTTAQANWGVDNECGKKSTPNEHCYAVSERNVAPYGGVLASILFADIDYNTFPSAEVPLTSGTFLDNEEWVTFDTSNEWIETGESVGETRFGESEEDALLIHPFYAQSKKRSNKKIEYEEYTSPDTMPAGGAAFTKGNPTEEAYNHFVIYDREVNGRFDIYWGPNEVGYYSGWPHFLLYQEAGTEVAETSRPYEYGRDEVADSDGGEWTPWEGDKWTDTNGAICLEANEESHAAGN